MFLPSIISPPHVGHSYLQHCQDKCLHSNQFNLEFLRLFAVPANDVSILTLIYRSWWRHDGVTSLTSKHRLQYSPELFVLQSMFLIKQSPLLFLPLHPSLFVPFDHHLPLLLLPSVLLFLELSVFFLKQ